ncbi:MAG: hypothetical protein P8Y28_07470 [Gammaproteobacteria bacterium]|jgi:hypothetical protein
MLANRISPLVVVLAALFALVSCDKFTTDSSAPAPTITAQGFSIESVQEGSVGQFGSLRLRIESPGRIDKLQIKERSYHVDLATTPERAHFKLFGIERKPLYSRDVTLDLQSYINQKLEHSGEYTIVVEVTDKLGQITNTNIFIKLDQPESAVEVEPKPEQTKPEPAQSSIDSAPVQTGHFEILRIGPREIEGNKVFGLTWKTVDEILVTIRVRKREGGASKLAGLSTKDYDNVITDRHLNQLLESVEDKDNVDFDTANNTGVNIVLGVVNLGKPYLIKTSETSTELSELGTTVTLRGEYKF